MTRLPHRYKPSAQVVKETRAHFAKLAEGDPVHTRVRSPQGVTLTLLEKEVRW